MKKKVIGLSTLLLVLLLGLFTTSYATDITLNQLKNFCVNVGIKQGISQSNMQNWVDNSSAFAFLETNLTNKLKNSSYQLYILSGGFNVYVYVFDYSINNKIVVRNTSDVDITTSGSGTYYQVRVNDNTWSYSGNANNQNYNVTKNGLYYSELNMYNGWGSTIWRSAPVYWTDSSIFDGPYQDSLPFTFISEVGLGTVSYNNYDYTLFEVPYGDLLLGQLYVPSGTIVNYQDIINYYWRWNNWQTRELDSSNIYLQLISNDDGDLSFNVKLKSDYIYPNTYYQYIWSDHTTEPYQITDGGCYIKDIHTVIVNGVVDPYQTFSGDYLDEYNNDLENQDMQQNLQDQTDQLLDSSEVDSILGGFSSSGDILDAFGYSPIENPFVVVIRNVFVGLNDVLLGSGNQTLDLSSFGMQLVLHSEDFVLPDNIITTFIHLVCNGFFVYGLYKYGFKLIQWINTGRLQNLLDETSGSTNYLF